MAVTNSRVVHEVYLGSTLPCRPVPAFQRRLNEAAKTAFGSDVESDGIWTNSLPSVLFSALSLAASVPRETAVQEDRMEHDTHRRDYTKLALAHFCAGAIEVVQAGMAAALVHVLIGGVYLHIAFARRKA